ncbi:hypothetical protein C8J57DRAFT_1522696 [Mycena rebaudengoi]|nr:hypothetical protein C8J57DRAFT_1522696 [Mycena rebaudengoi]
MAVARISQLVFFAEIFSRILCLARTPTDIAVCLSVSCWFSEFKQFQMSRLSWERVKEVLGLLLSLQNDDSHHWVKELAFTLQTYDDRFLTQRSIFAMLNIFTNLMSLTLSNSCITSHIHTSVTRLPHLQELHLIACGIFSRSDHPEGNQPFSVKFLRLADIQIFCHDSHRIDDLQWMKPSSPYSLLCSLPASYRFNLTPEMTTFSHSTGCPLTHQVLKTSLWMAAAVHWHPPPHSHTFHSLH